MAQTCPGTFQKILDEQRVTIMTTPTIMNSFLRKYAAIAELESELLKRLFVFQEVPDIWHTSAIADGVSIARV